MDADGVLKLFDSTWFAREIFTIEPVSSTSDRLEGNPEREIEEEPSKSNICLVKNLRSRPICKSLSFKPRISSDSLSPDSVLCRKVTELENPSHKVKETSTMKKGKGGKSLSDLELEEMKGFIDLGFVFSEKDQDSSIASIIPGLQRLGKTEEHVDSGISRPYLSKSWKTLRRRKIGKPLMKWKLPGLTNEVDMKDALRGWAHTVASTVR